MGEDQALHHAVHHIGCTICPEPHVVQDRVEDNALNLTWFRGGGDDRIISPSP